MFYFTAPGARASNLWAKSLHDGSEYPVTDFEGRRGNFAGLDTDGQNPTSYSQDAGAPVGIARKTSLSLITKFKIVQDAIEAMFPTR